MADRSAEIQLQMTELATDKSPSHLPKVAAVFSVDDIQFNVEFSDLFLREAAGRDSIQRGEGGLEIVVIPASKTLKLAIRFRFKSSGNHSLVLVKPNQSAG